MAKGQNAKAQMATNGIISTHSAKKTFTSTNVGRGGSSITAKNVGIRSAGKQTKNN